VATATEHELITRAALDVHHEYLHLVRTLAGWKIANALWRPR
jgi:hypothetical protein